jgi:hypothetical protein
MPAARAREQHLAAWSFAPQNRARRVSGGLEAVDLAWRIFRAVGQEKSATRRARGAGARRGQSARFQRACARGGRRQWLLEQIALK